MLNQQYVSLLLPSRCRLSSVSVSMCSLKAEINIVPDSVPLVSWTGSVKDKLELSRMSVRRRLEHLQDNVVVTNHCEPWQGVKDKMKAEKLKDVANNLVKQGKHLEAIQFFNTATRISPSHDNHLLGWICAGRSVSSLSLGLFDECLNDCLLGLKLLPNNLVIQRVKLYERLLSCSPELWDQYHQLMM